MKAVRHTFRLFILCSCTLHCVTSHLSAGDASTDSASTLPNSRSTKKTTKTILMPQYCNNMYDFSGFYVGVLVGYNHMHIAKQEVFHDFNYTDTAAVANAQSGAVSNNALSGRGVFGGGHLGYGKQFGQFYIGTQLEANLSNANSKQSENNGNFYNLGLRDLMIDLKNNLSASLRTGFAFDKTLIYVKGGVSLARFNITSFYPSFNVVEIGQPFSTSKTQIGAVAGAGIDVAATKNIILGGEVTYTQYKKFSVIHPIISTTRFAISTLSFQLKASYKF